MNKHPIIRNYPNAIGYSFRYYATEMINNGDIRLLAVDGVQPDRQSIKNGTYPLTGDFYAVTAGTDNPNIALLLSGFYLSKGKNWLRKRVIVRCKGNRE